ncbi:MAG: substrate-binding domain-containing protein [Gloeobacteraceae cyanobacterium ES-bin-316]|nr:substrate-binding domain-containing protein [Ferruginibacter sp.]
MKREIFRAGVWIAGCSLLTFFSCSPQKNDKPLYDSPTHGTIHMSIDESFKPVMDEQIAMYEASFPGTDIIPHYKPEAECLRDLLQDTSNRGIVITRGLTDKEELYLKDSLKYLPAWNPVASDAIAVIVNAASEDTLFTLKRLQQQLLGKINREQIMVFDGLNATSTVRFVVDSVLRGQKFDTSVVKAAKTTRDVLDFIASNRNAIGLIGINWIGNPEIPEQVAMLQKVKIAYVECILCQDTPYVKPMQQSILTHRYPLVRGLYYVNKENYIGLGTGFISFLKSERGQLIFKRAYLGPVMDLDVRNVRLNEELPEN